MGRLFNVQVAPQAGRTTGEQVQQALSFFTSARTAPAVQAAAPGAAAAAGAAVDVQAARQAVMNAALAGQLSAQDIVAAQGMGLLPTNFDPAAIAAQRVPTAMGPAVEVVAQPADDMARAVAAAQSVADDAARVAAQPVAAGIRAQSADQLAARFNGFLGGIGQRVAEMRATAPVVVATEAAQPVVQEVATLPMRAAAPAVTAVPVAAEAVAQPPMKLGDRLLAALRGGGSAPAAEAIATLPMRAAEPVVAEVATQAPMKLGDRLLARLQGLQVPAALGAAADRAPVAVEAATAGAVEVAAAAQPQMKLGDRVLSQVLGMRAGVAEATARTAARQQVVAEAATTATHGMQLGDVLARLRGAAPAVAPATAEAAMPTLTRVADDAAAGMGRLLGTFGDDAARAAAPALPQLGNALGKLRGLTQAVETIAKVK